MEEKDKEIETQSLQEEENDEEDENFVDFDDDYAADTEETPQLDEDLIEEVQAQENEVAETTKEVTEEATEENLQNDEGEKEQQNETQSPFESIDEDEQLSWWEDVDNDNSVVKKYLFNISKDLTSKIDKLSTKERNAYVNSAIRLKMEQEDENRQKFLKQKMIIHLVLLVMIFIAFTPIALFASHKAIILTFKNYKYSQENFEKLYRERFLHDNAYLRSIEHNKKYNVKK